LENLSGGAIGKDYVNLDKGVAFAEEISLGQGGPSLQMQNEVELFAVRLGVHDRKGLLLFCATRLVLVGKD
jgi:hypothetical protein